MGSSSDRVLITYVAGDEKKYDDETIYWIYPSPSAGTYITWLSDDSIEVNDKIIDIHDKKIYYNWKKNKEYKKHEQDILFMLFVG